MKFVLLTVLVGRIPNLVEVKLANSLPATYVYAQPSIGTGTAHFGCHLTGDWRGLQQHRKEDRARQLSISLRMSQDRSDLLVVSDRVVLYIPVSHQCKYEQ